MGFGKAFGFSLLAYAGLNFLFVIIAATIDGSLNLLFDSITTNPLLILELLFMPIIIFPGEVFMNLAGEFFMVPIDIAYVISLIGYFVAPFIAAVIAGRTGESKGKSFGGWFLTAVVSGTVMVVYLFLMYPIVIQDIIVMVISMATNGVFYGCFALLFTKTEYY